jgi:hypothetical protein
MSSSSHRAIMAAPSLRAFGIILFAGLTVLVLAPVRPLVAQVTPIFTEFTTTLQPGVRHDFILGPSSAKQGYVPVITPLQRSTKDATLQDYEVGPEFDGVQWNDVLHVQIPGTYSPMPVNIRVYGTGNLPIATEFTTTLQPGTWTGFTLGPSSATQAYIPVVTPLQASVVGASLQTNVVEPEFDGVLWKDVLRVQIPSDEPALQVNIRVYAAGNVPVSTEFTTTLQPGYWQGFTLGPSSAKRGFIPVVTPDPSSEGTSIERVVVLPEFDGFQWNDVLRVRISSSGSPLDVNITVHEVQNLSYGLPQIANGIQSDGIVWASNIAITNTAAVGSATASGVMTFTQDNGAPFNINFVDEQKNPVGSGNTIPFNVAGGQTKFFFSTAAGTLKVGFASIDSNLPIAVGGTFMEYGSGGTPLIAKAGVASAQPLTAQTMFAIKTSHSTTAVAVANASDSTASVIFQLLDTNGASAFPIVYKTLPAKNHTAFYIGNLFPGIPTNFFGTLSIISDIPLVTTALEFENTGQFATSPVFPLQ